MNLVEFWGLKVKPRVVRGKNMLYPLPSGKINDNIYAVRDKDVNMFIYKSGGNTIAIDACYKNSKYLKQELGKTGIQAEEISDIFLTHTDLDHAGGLDTDSGSFFPDADIHLGRLESRHLKKEIPRLKKLFIQAHVPVDIGSDYNLLDDGQVVYIDNIKIEALLVPGHTAGHLCYVIDDKYLFTGDSIILLNGKAYTFYDTWNIDTGQLLNAVKKIQNLDGIELMITSHTGYTADYKRATETIGCPLNWRAKDFTGQQGAPYNAYVL